MHTLHTHTPFILLILEASHSDLILFLKWVKNENYSAIKILVDNQYFLNYFPSLKKAAPLKNGASLKLALLWILTHYIV